MKHSSCITKVVFVLVLTIAHLPFGATGQNLGDPAPPVEFTKSINSNAKQGFHIGKFLVLDFWATWCGPCIASFPHLDSLTRQFASDSVVFAIMSSESEQKVSKMLADKKISAHQLLDRITVESRARAKYNDLYGLTAQAFKVVGIPHTVVISPENTLVWKGIAGELSGEILKEIINGRARQIQQNLQASKQVQQQTYLLDKQLIAKTKKDTIRNAQMTMITGRLPRQIFGMAAGRDKTKNRRYLEVNGQKLDFFYSYLTGLPLGRINNHSSDHYYVNYSNQTDLSTKEFNAQGLAALGSAVGATFDRKLIKTDVQVVEVSNRKLFLASTRPADTSSKHGSTDSNQQELIFLNMELASVLKSLEEEYGIPFQLGEPAYERMKVDMTIKKGGLIGLKSQMESDFGITISTKKLRIVFIDILKPKLAGSKKDPS